MELTLQEMTFIFRQTPQSLAATNFSQNASRSGTEIAANVLRAGMRNFDLAKTWKKTFDYYEQSFSILRPSDQWVHDQIISRAV